MTKVLALNGSPRMEKGNTALILNPFLEGMEEAGAEVELFYTRKLNINPCRGDFICWLKTPGQCWQKDDMQMLYPKLKEADIYVFATPVYVDGATGPMKNLIDRILPLAQPFFELRDGHCRHLPRGGHKSGKVVLVSNCGFWEMDNFDPLLVHIKAVCKNADREFAGALLRPHGEALRPMMEMGASPDDVFAAAKDAGRQLIRDGKMSPKTLKIVSRELMPLEMYFKFANETFQRALGALEK
jgi:multimeric flavodoxin WrbA